MWINKLKEQLIEQIWRVPPSVSRFNHRAVYLMRLLWIIGRGFVEDRCLLRAQALVYTTLLSIVPLLAVGLSLFKGVGGLDSEGGGPMEAILSAVLVDGIREQVLGQIMGAVNNVHGGAVGTVSFVFLIFTVLSLMGTIEKTFNEIWGVKKSRTPIEKVTAYWTVVTLGPIFMVISFTVTAALQSSTVYEYLTAIPILGAKVAYLVTFVMTMAAFLFLYKFMPNTKVKMLPAIFGAFVGAFLFEVAKLGYSQYVQSIMSSDSSTMKIYGSLAAFPTFLLWVYLLWSIVLLGAEAAFASQHFQQYEYEGRATDSSFSSKLSLGLHLSVQATRSFNGEILNWERGAIAESLNIPVRLVSQVLATLTEKKILMERSATVDMPAVFLPMRDPKTIKIGDVREALAGVGFSSINDHNRQFFSDLEKHLSQDENCLSDLATKGPIVEVSI